MSDELTLPEKIERLGSDADAVHAWANGDEITTVALGGTPTPSPRKMMHDIDARESAAAQAAIAAGVTAVEASATAAAQAAITAQNGADVVTGHAAELALVAGNITAIQGAAGAAQSAAQSEAAAAASATAAAAAVPDNLVQRVTDAEAQNTQQDTRLTAVETKNTQQDTRLDSAESALSGKANTDFSNVTPAAVQVIKNSNTASVLSTCTTTGDWTITGCKIGVPLDIVVDVISADGSGNNQVLLWTKSGATGGNSSGNDARFAIGRANGWFSTDFFRCYPTSTTVVIGVKTLQGDRLTAMQ